MYEIVFTSIILISLTLALLLELARPVYLMLSALLLLLIGGIIPIDEAFQGFANQGMLTVAILYIIAATLQNSSLFATLIETLLAKKDGRINYFKLLLPVAFSSAFINNTPLVASLIPQLKRWRRKMISRYPGCLFRYRTQPLLGECAPL